MRDYGGFFPNNLFVTAWHYLEREEELCVLYQGKKRPISLNKFGTYNEQAFFKKNDLKFLETAANKTVLTVNGKIVIPIYELEAKLDAGVLESSLSIRCWGSSFCAFVLGTPSNFAHTFFM